MYMYMYSSGETTGDRDGTAAGRVAKAADAAADEEAGLAIGGSIDDATGRDPSTLVDAREQFQALVETIWRLRQPDGCPWDREQTHESISGNMLEEAYEAVDAIEGGSSEHLCEELGDVLMQVVLQAQIAADEGAFNVADVARGINEKLIRRHPHVFGDVRAETPEEVRAIWDRVKLQEKETRDEQAAEDHERPAGLLDGVPTGMPALMEAQKVSRKAVAAGFEWDTVDDVWAQVDEEREEFLAEEPGAEAREMEFGDLLFALVNVARKEGIDAESALHASTRKFRARWAAMEDIARGRGVRLEDLSREELGGLWDEVKRAGIGVPGESVAAGAE